MHPNGLDYVLSDHGLMFYTSNSRYHIRHFVDFYIIR